MERLQMGSLLIFQSLCMAGLFQQWLAEAWAPGTLSVLTCNEPLP
jgi:hypothetical protein